MNRSRADRIGCPEFRENLAKMSRRGFVRAGALGMTGLSLPQLLKAEAETKSGSREKSVILLWMRGGPSQHETWDPKPDAPSEYRGAFGATSTSVPGVQICDLLPKCAKVMHKFSVIRSIAHGNAGHSAADQICFTGYPPGPDPNLNVHPSIGSIVAKEFQEQDPDLPAYVMIPKLLPGAGPAYLGNSYRPFETKSDPANEGPFELPDLTMRNGMTFDRITDRSSLLENLDQIERGADAGGQMESLDEFQQKAFDMILSEKARHAFDLDAEPAKIRERYGFMKPYIAPTPDRCGVPAWSQRILLARRLVEAGVRLVTVDLRWWDTHVKGYETMRDGFLPRWDQAFTALIDDLEERGLLDSTMVLAWGEFGRTPKVNKTGGRDHWGRVMNAAMLGGGIEGGRVVGSSDKYGGEPADNGKTPQDVLKTVYNHLGIDTTKLHVDFGGRPHPILPAGRV
ncbi:MAG: DUF1501 domain-containing protein, partial [Verrucomicrobiales bacterium]|nr:DUF1501 domain-containing protein [Verrucomicrobiales bacterium]